MPMMSTTVSKQPTSYSKSHGYKHHSQTNERNGKTQTAFSKAVDTKQPMRKHIYIYNYIHIIIHNFLQRKIWSKSVFFHFAQLLACLIFYFTDPGIWLFEQCDTCHQVINTTQIIKAALSSNQTKHSHISLYPVFQKYNSMKTWTHSVHYSLYTYPPASRALPDNGVLLFSLSYAQTLCVH